MNSNRRRVLRLTGAAATASVAGLAGCLSGDDETDDAESTDAKGAESDDEKTEPEADSADDEETTRDDARYEGLPRYASWLPAGEPTQIISLDAAAFDHRAVLEDAEAVSELEDPNTMLDLPFAGALYVLVTFSNLRYDDRSLDRVVTDEYETADFARDDLETSIDEVVHFDQVFVLLGDVDAEEIDAELTDSETRFETTFERVDGFDSFDLYQPAESEADFDQTFAVGSEAIVFASADDRTATDSIETVTDVLETRLYGRERAVDRIDDLRWLIETGGTGQLVLGEYGEDESAGSSDDEMAQFVSSLTYDGPTSASTEFAIDHDRDIPEEERIGFESELGAAAEDASVDVDGGRLSATASWEDLDAVLEIDE